LKLFSFFSLEFFKFSMKLLQFFLIVFMVIFSSADQPLLDLWNFENTILGQWECHRNLYSTNPSDGAFSLNFSHNGTFNFTRSIHSEVIIGKYLEERPAADASEKVEKYPTMNDIREFLIRIEPDNASKGVLRFIDSRAISKTEEDFDDLISLEYEFFKAGPFAMFLADGSFKGIMFDNDKNGSFEFVVHSPTSFTISFRPPSQQQPSTSKNIILRFFCKKLNVASDQQSWFSRIGPTAMITLMFVIIRVVMSIFGSSSNSQQRQPSNIRQR